MVMFSPGGWGSGERAENKDWLEPINLSREKQRCEKSFPENTSA